MCIGHEIAHAFPLFMDCSSNPIGIILELCNLLGLKFLRNWSISSILFKRIVSIRVNRLVTEHLTAHGRPDQRGGLCCL